MAPILLQRVLRLSLLALIALAAPLGAARGPVGPTSRVSPADGRDHIRPAVAASSAGALVVWQGEHLAPGATNPDYEIFAQRYDAFGAPAGAPFRVNQQPFGDQARPAVAALAGGGFVVAWDGFDRNNTGQSRNIYMRRLGADGAPIGDDLLVNTTPGGGQFSPALAAHPAGGFAVAWHGVVGGDPLGVALRRFDADGSPRDAAELRPYGDAPAADADQSDAALAFAADGALTLAWESYSYDLRADRATYAVEALRFDAAGAPVGAPQTLASGDDADPPADPAVAAGAGSSAAVAWAREEAAGAAIELAFVGPPGLAPPPATVVSPPASAERAAPALALDADGSALVVWPDRTTRSAGAPVGLAARRVGANGQPEGAEFYPALPAPYASAASGAVAAAIAPGAAGDLLIAWDNEESGGGAPIGAVYLRRYSEAAAVLLPAGELRAAEGGPALGLDLALRTQPAAPVRLALTPASPQLRLNGGAPGAPLELIFTPQDALTPQRVGVTADDDSAVEGPHSAQIGLALAAPDDPAYAAAPILLDGAPVRVITVTIADNDSGGTPEPTPEPAPFRLALPLLER